jgi:hypothetical protein
MPIHDILLKHNKHYFEYLDNIEQLQIMYHNINFPDENLKPAFDPHQLFFSYEQRDMLKILINMSISNVFGNTKKNKKLKQEVKKIEAYMNIHEFIFPKSFCQDMSQVFL